MSAPTPAPATAGGYVSRKTKESAFPLKKDEVRPDKPEGHHLDYLAIQARVYQSSGWSLAGTELISLITGGATPETATTRLLSGNFQ